MSTMKVTQLSTGEVNAAFIDNKLENIWLLSLQHTQLYKMMDIPIGSVLRHIRKGSAFIRLEISEDDSRTEE